MSEVKGKKRGPKKVRKPRRPQYNHHPFATNVAIYSPDGSPVPASVLEQVEVYIASVALQNNLLTAVTRASS
jgi:hypothetical protein